MIFVTGDCHGDYRRFNMRNFPEQKKMTKDDYVIVCGDFGYWTPSREQDYDLEELADRSFTTLFIDGNHEYFRTNQYLSDQHYNKYRRGLFDLPEKKWKGGKVHMLNDSVIHLMRGYVFDIDGHSFFTFGGANSHDIQDGVYDPYDYGGPTSREWKKKYNEMRASGYLFRVDGFSWRKEEMPTREEMERGRAELRKTQYRVDYILSHEGPEEAVKLYRTLHRDFESWEPDILRDYLQGIDDSVEYRKWIFGHHHDNVNIDQKHLLIYEQIIRVC